MPQDMGGFVMVEDELERAGDDFEDLYTEGIVLDKGFSETIKKAQDSLVVESRLMSYSLSRGFSAESMTQSGWIKVELAGDKKTSSAVAKYSTINEEEEKADSNVGEAASIGETGPLVQEADEAKMLQQAKELSKLLNGLDRKSAELLCRLCDDGVEYTPHQCVYQVGYLRPVAGNGDCLFLSMEQIFQYQSMHASMPGLNTSKNIRQLAVSQFLAEYHAAVPSDQLKISKAVANLYWPDVTQQGARGGWGMSQVQTRRLVARRKDRDLHRARILQMQEHHQVSWEVAAATEYLRHATPVKDVEAYCQYMLVGDSQNRESCNSSETDSIPVPPLPPGLDTPHQAAHGATYAAHAHAYTQQQAATGAPEHYIVSLHYSSRGLFHVDDDESRIAWGDDFMLQALASALHREVYVVLLGNDQMFFLPHSPKKPGTATTAAATRGCTPPATAVGEPLFLLMRTSGNERGGDHYEPMQSHRVLAEPLQMARDSALGATSPASATKENDGNSNVAPLVNATAKPPPVVARKVLAVLGEV